MRFSLAAILFCAVAAAGASRANAQAFSEADKRLYVVPYAHLDTQSRWTIQDTIQKFLPATLHENFDLLEKYPNYCVSFPGAFRYMLIKEYYPEDYAQLKKYIAAGRWFVAGACLDEVDAVIPSPESLIRQILYGNGFFKKEFGKTANEMLLADSNGFSYALPSVAAHCGISGFSSYKLSWNKLRKIPFALGNWVGPDGHSIVAALDPGRFFIPLTTDVSSDPAWTSQVEAQGRASGIFAGYRYLGGGYQGGAPDEASVKLLDAAASSPTGDTNVVIAGAGQLFADLTADQKRRLPSYKGELLMSAHGVGGYTAHPKMKRWNRRNEQLADAAERAAVLANSLVGAEYPAGRLRENWIRFLSCQMHEVITGTAAPDVFHDAWNNEALAENNFEAILRDSIGAISGGLKTSGAGVPLAVFNPLVADRNDAAEAKVIFPSDTLPDEVSVLGPDGEVTESEIVGRDEANHTLSIVFLAKMPPLGVAVYRVVPKGRRQGLTADRNAREAKRPSPLSASDKSLGLEQFGELTVSRTRIENSRYNVSINAEGDIAQIIDKLVGHGLLQRPIRIESLPDLSAEYPAWEIPYLCETLSAVDTPGAPAKVEIAEAGPARVALNIQRRLRGSAVDQRVSLAAGAAGDHINIETTVDWHGRGQVLKMSFGLQNGSPNATYDVGLGTVSRGNDTAASYEVPAQQWVDLSGANSDSGVAIITLGECGWDKPDNHTLRSTLIHTPATRFSFPDQNLLDNCRQKFSHGIAGHRGGWQGSSVQQIAARVNQPLRVFQALPHDRPKSAVSPFVRCSTGEMEVRAMKLAEEGSTIVLRLQEVEGKSIKDARLSFAAKVKEFNVLNGAEQRLGKGEKRISPTVISLNLAPYEVKTISVALETEGASRPPPGSQPVPLAFNVQAPFGTSTEPLPTKIDVDGLSFQLANPMELNAVASAGQVLHFPAAKNSRRLSFLAAAAGKTCIANFVSGGSTFPAKFSNLSSAIGSWDFTPVEPSGAVTHPREPGFYSKQEVAWTCNHAISASAIPGPHSFRHVDECSLMIDPKQTSVTLPNHPDLLIFAASLGRADYSPVSDASFVIGDVPDGETPEPLQPGANSVAAPFGPGKARIPF